jgi:hypothetical protein
MNWYNLWIETNSSFVVNAFQNARNDVAWNLRNRWRNALVMFKQLNGMVSHIFREGNQVLISLEKGIKLQTLWQILVVLCYLLCTGIKVMISLVVI